MSLRRYRASADGKVSSRELFGGSPGMTEQE
jgi:hypothetical protein